MKKIIFIFVLLLFGACSIQNNSNEKPLTTTSQVTTSPIVEEEIIKKEKTTDLSFLAVGDNLIHGAVYKCAAKGDGTYDFMPFYQYVQNDIQKADISFINQETIVGGKELGLSHYPRFNSPEEVIDAIDQLGFDLVNTATNHSLDKGEKGILNSLETFKQYPSLVVSGTASSFEEQETLKTLVRNDVTIGFLAYTTSTNGLSVPKGKEYLVSVFNKDTFIDEITNARSKCDILIVSMHWGTENSHKVNDFQREWAKKMNEAGVDIIIGTHPHVIQDVEILKNEQDKETLVMYSLGNFLSAQDQVDNILEEMVTCNIQYNYDTKEVHFLDVTVTPLVDHFDKGWWNYRIYKLKDYTEELKNAHRLTPSISYMKQVVDDVITHDSVYIDY